MKKTTSSFAYLILLGLLLSITLIGPQLLFAEGSNTTEPTYFLEVLQISDDPLLNSTILVADKATRQLFVFDPSKNLLNPEKYEIDIGKNGGNKTKRNDKKTPEGIYALEKKMIPPEIPYELYGSMAFTTNYPNVFDKTENKTGDGIWLHSVPDTVPLDRGSRGCVVVRNDNIKKLDQQIKLDKSYLIINDKIAFVDQKTHEDKKQFVLKWFNQWKTLWQTQDIDTYIGLYSDLFTSPPGFNKKSWEAHKKRLKAKYTNVQIEIGNAHIFNQKNQYILRFIQKYQSDQYQDRGLKTLYLVDEKQNGELKVLREEWIPLKSNN